MDLPKEDKTAIAKRRAIQALMRNKSLSPQERQKKMQEIMRGNFPMDDSESEEEEDESWSGSESSSGSSYEEEEESISMEGTESGDESISVSEATRDNNSVSSSQYSGSGSHYSHSQQSARTEDDSRGSSRGGGGQKNANYDPIGRGSESSNRSRNRRKNNALSRRESVESTASAASTSSVSASSQKEKQKALLEISRDKSLSAKERQAKMKEIMQTAVQGTVKRSASNTLSQSEHSLNNSNHSNDYMGKNHSGGPPMTRMDLRRPSRSRPEDMADSIRECTIVEDVKPLRTSRRRLMGNATEIKQLVTRVQRNDPSVTKIELQKMNLSDEDVIPLLDSLGKNEYVTSLDLRRNRIGTEGCSTLASAILDNTTLTSVDISGNNLGDEGMEDLSKVIPYNRALLTLNVEDNKVGDAGASSIAESLMENETLKELNLSGNLIEDGGASDLFKVLSSANHSLSSLLLRFNAISDRGATELASALLDNESLRVVDLGHNKITQKGAKDLLKVVSINDTLEVLELGGNTGIEEDMLDDIKRALEEEEESSGSEDESGSDESGSSYSEVSSSRGGALREASSSRRAARRQASHVESESESESESENDESITMDDSNREDNDNATTDNSAPTGGEAMLEDMPDETNAALAKRKLIQEVMKDTSLSPQERHKKMQDIMAGRVELPKVEPKTAAKPKAKPKGSKPKAQEEEEDQAPTAPAPAPAAAAASSSENGTNSELTGGEAMLTDMPDEDDTALAKRRAIQEVMRDKSLSPQDRQKKMQDIMAGRVELPKVEKKKPAAPPQQQEEVEAEASSKKAPERKASRGGGRRRRGTREATERDEESGSHPPSSQTSTGEEEAPAAAAPAPPPSGSGESSSEQLTGGEAMLEDMPDETNTALAKRKAIQEVMKDTSLTPQERHKKMQDIMAGRVELPKVEAKSVEAVAAADSKKPPERKASSGGGRRARQANREEEQSDSSSEGDSKDSSSSSEESLSQISSEGEEGGGSSIENDDANTQQGGGEGANAMLRDMPDEDDTALSKRRAIQEVMRDKSLSPQDRQKKMQDIMAGRVKLPPPPKKEPETKPVKPAKLSQQANTAAVPTMREQQQNQRPKKTKEAASKLPDPWGKKSLLPVRKGSDLSQERKSKAKNQGKEDKKKPVQQVSISDDSGKAPVSSSSRSTSPKKQSAKQFMRQPSYDGGTRAAIANEWKQRMMAVHPRSHDNLLDILLAHQYRLSLKFPPKQSFFRVVAVVFFSTRRTGNNERYHVVGTNDEPHSVAGSICAERAALMQLRFIPDLEEITKVVIVTDDVDAISPGMLCREFMASHDRIPWNVPIVLGRSVCRKCGFTVSGKACAREDPNVCFDESVNEVLRDVNSNIFATCTKGHEESKNKDYPTPHDFVGTVTTLKDLFPYPSLYSRLSSKEALEFGEDYLEKVQSNPLSKNKPKDQANIRNAFAKGDKRFNDGTSTGSYRQESFDLTMLANIMEEDEEEEGKSNGDSFTSLGGLSNATSHQGNGKSKESSSFRSTSSNNSNIRMTGRGVKSSMTHSLKTTIDFMRQVREDRHELDGSGLSGLSDLPGTLDHLTARTLRISSRLKPSQRREKLLRLATEVTAMESHQKNAHPIRYGAAVLFSDGTVAIASQKVAVEYGCTLDAVGQLASVIDRKAIQIEEDSPPCRPILLAQCDQFGIAHPPFAPGRAFLSERGYGDCKVLIHQKRQNKEGTNGVDHNASVEDIHGIKREELDLRLVEVEANDLAPAPPDIFGTLIVKNHTAQGLIQF